MRRVVIIGAGLIGLGAAHALRRRGAEVTLVEVAAGAHGASVVNAGWVCPGMSEPMPAPGLTLQSLRWMLRGDSPLYIRPSLRPAFLRWLFAFWRHCNATDFAHGLAALAALSARTLELLDRLVADGIAFEMHRDGILAVYRDDRALERAARAGHAGVELVRGAALRDLEPGLSEQVRGGLWHREERSVRPDSLTDGLAAWLRAHGATLHYDTAVRGFVLRDGRVAAVVTAAGAIEADAVLIAAGAHSGRLAAQLGARLPIEAGKGYCLDYHTPPVVVRRPLEFADAYVACTPMGGRVRCAGTMELSGIDQRVRPDRVAAIARCIAGALPGWPADPSQATVRSGLRPLTPDGLPAIGCLPGVRNVAVASGHAMLGLTLAASTGEAVAELMDGTAPAWLGAFDPARFH